MPSSNGDALRPSLEPNAYLKPLPPPKKQPSREKLDAGLRSLDHYRNKLPLWRYLPRQWLIPFVRWETPYLAAAQGAVRSSALDIYFSMTANLGTHTFFMIFLPILFWCGLTHIARGSVHILASGVFFSGFIKDLLCLPRPLSPPLQRITMSKSAALEYGFPSTHSTNAVSVAAYALLLLESPGSGIRSDFKVLLQVVFCAYATSIILGRLYCGMHGLLDIGVGSALGVLLSFIQYTYGDDFDQFIQSGSFKQLVIVVLIVLVLVRVHPEPADDCPCFDDSVAFAGVIIGIEVGNWRFARSGFAWDEPVPATVPFRIDVLGWPRTILRILTGVFMIFAWRGFMKPILLKTLPPLFRIIERLGLSLPRRFFKPATEYKQVPKSLKVDNVIPSMTEMSSLITSIRHLRRRTSISVGPQSEADAYETLAYRERRRRESKSEKNAASPIHIENKADQGSYFELKKSTSASARPATDFAKSSLSKAAIEAETAVYTPLTPEVDLSLSRSSSQERRQDEKETREMFSKLEKPRVRYDVEVVTKLIVYTGIAWISVDFAPVVFELCGLGVGKRPG